MLFSSSTATALLVSILSLSSASARSSQNALIHRQLPSRLDTKLELRNETNSNLVDRGRILTLGTDVCVRISTGTKFNLDAGVGPDVKLTVNADTCLCLDGDVYVDASFGNGLKIGIDGQIVTSTNLGISAAAQRDLASQALVNGVTSLNAGVCLQAELAVNDPNSVHAFDPRTNGGCCKRGCKNGYTLNPSTKRCVPSTPTCDSKKEILCNGNCYDKTQYTCPSGKPKKINEKRSAMCPGGMMKCPIGEMGMSGWECVDTRRDIESCGGCLFHQSGSNAIGADCTSLPNVSEVACMQGSCVVMSCQRGYDLINNAYGNSTECVERPKAFVAPPKKVEWTGFSIQNRAL